MEATLVTASYTFWEKVLFGVMGGAIIWLGWSILELILKLNRKRKKPESPPPIDSMVKDNQELMQAAQKAISKPAPIDKQYQICITFKTGQVKAFTYSHKAIKFPDNEIAKRSPMRLYSIGMFLPFYQWLYKNNSRYYTHDSNSKDEKLDVQKKHSTIIDRENIALVEFHEEFVWNDPRICIPVK